MFRTIRNLTLPVLLAAAFAATAQTPSQSAAAGGNPAARGTAAQSSFAFRNSRQATDTGALNSSGIKRPTAQFGPVTPVPEPSEWAMLVAGLAFVGWVIRRKTRQ